LKKAVENFPTLVQNEEEMRLLAGSAKVAGKNSVRAFLHRFEATTTIIFAK